MASPVSAQAPFCPTCGSAAVWHPSLGQWGCDRCRQMLPAAPSPQPQAQPQAQPQGPACPQCHGWAVWHPAMNNWGCDRCQMMLPPVPAIPPVQETSTGMKILINIVVFIISTAILVAIKLAMR